MYTAQAFVEDVVRAIRSDPQDAQGKCLEYMQQAVGNPDLLQDYQEQLSNSWEFHMARTPECAIKVFKFKATEKPNYPHDHAGFWGDYIIFRGVMEMAFFEEENPGTEGWPGLRELTRFSMPFGATRKIRPDQIHAVWSNQDGTLAIAVYNGDLNSSRRRIYDLVNKVCIRDLSQWQTRETLGHSGGDLRQLKKEEIRGER